MLLLILPAFADPVGCPMHEVLTALAGRGPAPDPAVLQAPPNLNGQPTRRATGKSVYGTPYSVHYESENFTINAISGVNDRALLEETAGYLEGAWAALQAQGWPTPVSADRYLIWVLLDDSLSGTGLTTEYNTDDYPDGYPVIYLNPYYAWDPDFFEALAAHEFMHAVQYAMRDYDWADEDETWYWEASAMWADELIYPLNDTYADQAWYYMSQPSLSYASTTNYHQYGMFVINAYLEEVGGGQMKTVWEDGETRQGEAWSEILADSIGSTPEAVWADFSAQIGNQLLRESNLYGEVDQAGWLEDGASGAVEYLGTDFYEVRADTWVEADTADVILSVPGESGTSVYASTGTLVAVTGLSSPRSVYTLTLSDEQPNFDGGDSGGPGLDSDPPNGETAGEAEGKEEVAGCGCTTTSAASSALWLGLLGLATLRRRQPQR